jgi:hypothetical protein
VDSRRRVLLEQQDRAPCVGHELLARARKQPPDVHARVLGGVELALIVGDEGPRVRDLAALDVDDAKAAARLDWGRASFPSRNMETLADAPMIRPPGTSPESRAPFRSRREERYA